MTATPAYRSVLMLGMISLVQDAGSLSHGMPLASNQTSCPPPLLVMMNPRDRTRTQTNALSLFQTTNHRARSWCRRQAARKGSGVWHRPATVVVWGAKPRGAGLLLRVGCWGREEGRRRSRRIHTGLAGRQLRVVPHQSEESERTQELLLT